MSDEKSTDKPTKKSSKKSNKKIPSESWKNHDLYHTGISSNRIVTRSQTAFLRAKNTLSDLDLYADASRHQPPDQPHLIEVMKGQYGAIPRTIITRSTGQFIPVSEDLVKKMAVYKKHEPTEEEKKDEPLKEEKKDEPPKEEKKEPPKEEKKDEPPIKEEKKDEPPIKEEKK